jgi:hypothetical protein
MEMLKGEIKMLESPCAALISRNSFNPNSLSDSINTFSASLMSMGSEDGGD